ncbi:unnamed protein product, partial [Nesidiocoris tenuis]
MEVKNHNNRRGLFWRVCAGRIRQNQICNHSRICPAFGLRLRRANLIRLRTVSYDPMGHQPRAAEVRNEDQFFLVFRRKTSFRGRDFRRKSAHPQKEILKFLEKRVFNEEVAKRIDEQKFACCSGIFERFTLFHGEWNVDEFLKPDSTARITGKQRLPEAKMSTENINEEDSRRDSTSFRRKIRQASSSVEKERIRNSDPQNQNQFVLSMLRK